MTNAALHITKTAPSDEEKASMLKKFSIEGRRQTAVVKFKPATASELKALGEELPDGYIAGWASTNELDLYNHVVQTGAFSEAISKRGLKGPRGIKLLIGHDWDKVGGIIHKLEYRGSGLWIEAQLNLAISYAKDSYEAAKMNGGLSFSVGFMLQDYGVAGNEKDGEYLLITKGDLYEISVVPFPGNEGSTMDFVKSRDATVATVAEFEKRLVALGLTKSRNDARRITQEVKNASLLFQKGDSSDPESNDTPSNTSPPVLALSDLNALSDLMAKAKAILAPAAKG